MHVTECHFIPFKGGRNGRVTWERGQAARLAPRPPTRPQLLLGPAEMADCPLHAGRTRPGRTGSSSVPPEPSSPWRGCHGLPRQLRGSANSRFTGHVCRSPGHTSSAWGKGVRGTRSHSAPLAPSWPSAGLPTSLRGREMRQPGPRRGACLPPRGARSPDTRGRGPRAHRYTRPPSLGF